MTKISTKHLSELPEIETLKKLCKSLATLDAIICREWQYRYYSYDRNWDLHKSEEHFQMRNGSGDEFGILFSKFGAIINGNAHESEMSIWKEVEIKPKNISEKINSLFGKKKTEFKQQIWKGVVEKIPAEFNEFIFGEPVKSIGTTFCIWKKNNDANWKIGEIEFPEDDYGDGSFDLLYIFDNNPKTYVEWALDYYDEDFENRDLKLENVKHIYDQKPLTRELILELNPEIKDFEELKNDLDNIGYEYKGL